MQLKKIHFLLVLFNLLLFAIVATIAIFFDRQLAVTLSNIGVVTVLASVLTGYLIVKRGLTRARKKQKEGEPFFTGTLLDDEDK